MISKEEVSWGYKLLLGRDPENEEVILEKTRHHETIKSLVQDLLSSEEFEHKNFELFQNMNGIIRQTEFNPPMGHIDIHLAEAQQNKLFKLVQETWEFLGQDAPYWSVITLDEYKNREAAKFKEKFYSSGKTDLRYIQKMLTRNNINIDQHKTCLEFGCGVGRVTYTLASLFDKVYACDISTNHLKLAQSFFDEKGLSDKIEPIHISTVNTIKELPKVDFIYSAIVLQHNPPPLIHFIFKQLLSSLRPNGIAYIQIPTYEKRYEFSIDKYLSNKAYQKTKGMEMHVLPQEEVFKTIAACNASLIEVFEDNWTGMKDGISNSFIIRKN